MKRPLFWMGFVFLSSSAVFLRFEWNIAALICVGIALVGLLFSNAKLRTGLVLFLACAALGGLFSLLYTAGVRHYLSPVLAKSEQPVEIVLTITERQARGNYCRWQGRGTVTASGVKRTFTINLSGYTEEESDIGDVLRCTAKIEQSFSGDSLHYKLVKLLPPPEISPHHFTHLRLRWQQALSNRAGALSKDVRVSGVLSAILTGDRTRLTKDVTANFRGSGLSHILVVSGLHLILVSHLVGILLQHICTPRRAGLLSLAFCWLFAMVSGLGSSIIRAALMLTLVHVAELFNRRSDTLTSLMVAALLMGLQNPYILLSVSFLLSFGAVAGLAALEKPVFNALQGHKPHGGVIAHLLQSLSVGIAAQAGAAPVLIWFFGLIPLLGLIANLAAVWLIEPIMLLGLTALGLSFVSPLLGSIAALPCNALLRLLLLIARIFSRLPGAQLGFTERWQTAWLFGSLFLFILILAKRPRAPLGRLAVMGCLAAGLTVSVLFATINFNRAEIIVFKNSGAAVICGSRAVLFGAPQNGYALQEIQTAFARSGVKSLDAIVIDSSEQATYHTAALAMDYPETVLCCPPSRASVTFSHAADLPLRSLPQDTLLYGAVRYHKSGSEITLTFSEAELLKIGGNCAIIGKYAELEPFSASILRARTKL
ncbi:MAG: internalization-related competence protein ComEC/Rec2 [Oscillospiraceae bacterium]|jgi:ComEC/Rec2-related protein|nr:internalization-related competence protein ComEC/Rec2 [Oscillospiraceae bacterium]